MTLGYHKWVSKATSVKTIRSTTTKKVDKAKKKAKGGKKK